MQLGKSKHILLDYVMRWWAKAGPTQQEGNSIHILLDYFMSWWAKKLAKQRKVKIIETDF